jgi:2-amino-4-hydroxy-6-hydroxymethyldihydropteridine diphosphokinase
LLPASLAIGLGANLPSPAGPPLATLLAVRSWLEQRLLPLGGWLCWSPLYRTAPLGGPADQPDYLNAVVLIRPLSAAAIQPSSKEAIRLLSDLQELERRFARRRLQRWGPRSLDLDLLWWGDLTACSTTLELPHPRMLERSFVLAPLAAIDAGLRPPGAAATAETLLGLLLAREPGPAPQRLAGQPGWPE